VSNTKGHKLEELKAPISKLSYLVLPGKVDVSVEYAQHFHSALRELNILMPQRIPLVFALNGIETAGNGDTQFELVIGPKSSTFYPPVVYVQSQTATTATGRSWIVETRFTAYIIDKSRFSKKVWEGELAFLNSPTSQVNAKSVDKFAIDILKQLATDGMVKLESDEINVSLQ
jgi:hypothetical protein